MRQDTRWSLAPSPFSLGCELQVFATLPPLTACKPKRKVGPAGANSAIGPGGSRMPGLGPLTSNNWVNVALAPSK